MLFLLAGSHELVSRVEPLGNYRSQGELMLNARRRDSADRHSLKKGVPYSCTLCDGANQGQAHHEASPTPYIQWKFILISASCARAEVLP